MTRRPVNTDVPTITEVLAEPGQCQLWVTFETLQTHHVDLLPLLFTDTHQSLILRPLFERVKIGRDGRHLIWPGGVSLDARSIQEAPYGLLPVGRLAVLPADQRYRPLLPLLRHQQPASILRPQPIEPVVVERLFHLKTTELHLMLQALPVPAEIMLARLYDLAVFLTEYFAPEHLHGLLRRPWRYGEQLFPSQPLLHSMLGCLQHGRPDVIERPCMKLLTGSL